MLADSSKLWRLHTEVLSVVPGERAGGAVLAAASIKAHCKANAECY